MDYKVFVQDGHAFETDKKDPESLADYESGDMHNGPHCLICEDYWCQHCSPDIFKEKCPGREHPTLEGLEWRQPQITAVIGRQKPRY